MGKRASTTSSARIEEWCEGAMDGHGLAFWVAQTHCEDRQQHRRAHNTVCWAGGTVWAISFCTRRSLQHSLSSTHAFANADFATALRPALIALLINTLCCTHHNSLPSRSFSHLSGSLPSASRTRVSTLSQSLVIKIALRTTLTVSPALHKTSVSLIGALAMQPGSFLMTLWFTMFVWMSSKFKVWCFLKF